MSQAQTEIDPVKYLPLVKKIARRLKSHLTSPNILECDLVQEGCIGLLYAVKKYDPSQGASFRTYAAIRIHGAMLDGLKETEIRSRSAFDKYRSLEAALRELNNNGKKGTDKELSEYLDVSPDKLSKMKVASHGFYDISIDKLFLSEKYELPGDMSLSHFTPTLDILEKEELLCFIDEFISTLPERTRLIWIFYYRHNLIMRQIGEILALSEGRINQLISAANAKMEDFIKEKYGLKKNAAA